jgi:hypothetical protein
MGFFDLLETFFFISLAITFVLIMMLVYHFKGRLVILEQKCDTMFEIINNLIKEMKNIQARVIAAPVQQSSFGGPMSGLPIDFMSMLGGNGFPQGPPRYEEDYEEDYEEEDDEDEMKKIVVSDTELDSDDEDDEKVKVIHVDISEQNTQSESLPDLEEMDPEESEEGNEQDGKEPLDKEDYKKMDISFLRTLVISRGLATDTKRLKKADLVKLLSDE